jgi:Spy/CpxP family protein refolding chaperone
MSLKNKFLTGFAMATAMGVFAVAGSAQTTTPAPQTDGQKQEKRWGGHRKGGDGARGMRGGHGMMFRDLNLTDAQKAQIKTIMDTNKPTDAEMQQMKSLMEARKNGGTLTDDQKAQFKAFREQRRAKQEAIQQQILAILTPEQKQQLEQKQQERRQRMQERRQQRQQGDKPATDDGDTN